jgi:CHAD domain-containing protein
LIRRTSHQFRLAGVFGAEEAVHELRVGIKRLRAFQRLAGSLNPRLDPGRHFRPVRRLFKAAENLRDAQVRMNLIRQVSLDLTLNLSEYYNFVKHREEKARKAFSSFCSGFDLCDFERLRAPVCQALAGIEGDYMHYRTKRFFHSNLSSLRDLVDRTREGARDYHRIRVLTKETRYIGEILMQCWGPTAVLRSTDSHLMAMHQALGRWHDAQSTRESAELFLRSQAPKPLFDRHSYPMFLMRLSRDEAQNLSTFGKRWNEFLDYAKKKILTGVPGALHMAA